MKKTYFLKHLLSISLLTALFLGSINSTFAQSVRPSNGTIEHNDSERPCLYVNLDPEPKPIKKAWKSFLKKNYDFKIKGIGFLSNKDLLYAEDVVIEKLSPKRMDFYTQVIENEVGTEMKVFGSFGYDVYISKSETPEEYATMKAMLNEFLESYLPDYYKDQVKDTEEKVKSLTKEVEGLEKDISKNNKEIEDLKEELEKMNKEASEKEELLKTASEKLENRTKKLERIKSELNK